MELNTYTMVPDSEIKDKKIIAMMTKAGDSGSHLLQKSRNLSGNFNSSDIWISSEESGNLLGITKRAINKNIKSGKYTTKLVQMRGGQQYRILLSSLPLEAQQKYWMERREVEIKEKASASAALQDWQKEIALTRFRVIRLYNEYVLTQRRRFPRRKKTEIKREFVNLYNKHAYPEYFEVTGKISYPTVERWQKTLKDAGNDPFSLAPEWGKKRGKRSISRQAAEILIACYDTPNQPSVEKAIRDAKKIFDMRGIYVGVCDMTLRRVIEDHIKFNADVSGFLRYGNKWLNDHMLPYLERDRDAIEVGDIVVADGHTLNFEIIDPNTGRPKRMTLILVFDMKSNYPLGWIIMPTENVQNIAAAYRHAILTLGFIPRVFYLDNGKAFRAKFFTNTRDLTGISGLFERLGTEVIHAWPYHGQSKTIERFFGTLLDAEKNLPSYSGNSIENKPARMSRNEKFHARLYTAEATLPTIKEAEIAITLWFKDYVNRKAKGGYLKGRTPLEVFQKSLEIVKAQPDYQERLISPEKLNYLMMETKVKKLYRNGIRHLGGYYYNELLYSLSKSARYEFTIKYDIHDSDSILVFDKGKYICEAKRTDKYHPAAAQLGKGSDVEQLRNALEIKQGLRKSTITLAKEHIKNTKLSLPTSGKPALESGDVISKQTKKRSNRKKAILQEQDSLLSSYAASLEREEPEEDEIFAFETDKEYAKEAKQ